MEVTARINKNLPSLTARHRRLVQVCVAVATCLAGVHVTLVLLDTHIGSTRIWNGNLHEHGPFVSAYDVHVIWVAPRLGVQTAPLPIPVHGWRRLFANLVVWDKDRIEREFPEHVSMLRTIPVAAWISDIMRYLIVYRYGGVYLDTDFIAINSDLRGLLARTDNFTVCEWHAFLDAHKCQYIANGVIAAPPHNAALECAVNESLARTREALRAGAAFSLDISGPVMWTECCIQHGFNVLPSSTFLPCSFFARPCVDTAAYRASGVYGMHIWSHSWKA